ncbi:hypothetical protein [Bacteroides thetaiotaomicron]|uniref:hypothetical protein n=1 Tax=Bacteroides thetaiotaomicron TaxID=818 RepID=UPI003567874E
MKKFNDANVGLFILLTTCLSLFSCNNDNDNYPKDYVGFEKSTRTVECDKNQSESELQIKIIATDKSKEDRTVLLATPALPAGQAPIMKLTETKVTIKAGQKSATTTIKLYPKKMVLKQQNTTLSCTPQWKEGSVSKLTILLKRN